MNRQLNLTLNRCIIVFLIFLFSPLLLIAQLNPLQMTGLGLTGQDINWNYNMGYRFTVNQDGQITQLGGRWSNGIVHTVRLYTYPAGNIIATVNVIGDINWTYANITPVNVLAGQQFVVAVRLNSQSSGAYTNFASPIQSGALTIENSVFLSNSNSMPTGVSNTNMYGQADITFIPCTYAGSISASNTEIIKGDSTVLTVSSNIGSIQWQSSLDNINFVDILGQTSTQLNSSALDTTTYFRTFVTGGSCGSDTSTSIKINVIESSYPLRTVNPDVTGMNINWNYNMGYRFTVEEDGQITQLGGRWGNGVIHTVRLYDYPAGTILATASISGNSDWKYSDISPINTTAGQQFVVAVRLDAQFSGYYSQMGTPISSGGINITNSTYLSNSNAMPTNSITTYMYGQADIKFEPCDFAGTLLANTSNIEVGDSTTIFVTDNTSAIQWQLSTDNITYVDISGATGISINTGTLFQTTYYRTVLSTPTCGGDTSNIIVVLVKDPLRPLQNLNPEIISLANNWNYNMGYRFTANKNGQVTELGGRWRDGVLHTVRLYSYPAGTVLASSNIAGLEDWAFNSITPVNLIAGQQYVVAVRLDAQSSGIRSSMSTPVSSGEITIDNATYLSNSNNMPTNSVTTNMYGQADIKFIPCVSAGTILANDGEVCPGSETILSAAGAEGNLQWQSSIDNIIYSNISGATDSIFNTGSLLVKTYFRLIASAGCGNDTSNIDSVSIIGGGSGTPWLWTAAVNTMWSNPCNWSNGVVPSSGDSAIIPAGISSPTGIPTISLSYLSLDNISGISLTNNLTIEDNLVLIVGNVSLGSANLIIEADAVITGGYSTAYIASNGTGVVRKQYASADGSSFVIPIGDGSNFSPVTIDLNPSSTLGVNPYIEFRTVNSIHPNIGTPNDYITRYWELASNDITNIDYDIICTYANTDIVGTEVNMFTQRERLAGGWETLSVVNTTNNTISGSNITETGDFSAADIITVVSAQSGDWSIASTWLGGIIPDANQNAIILHSHNISLTASVTINSLDINSGGELSISGDTLTILEDLTVNGLLDASGTIDFNGINPQNIISVNNLTFEHLIINNSAGVNINSSVTFGVTGILTLTNGNFNVSDAGAFILISDANGDAIIDAANNTGTISGNVTMQRYISGVEGHRYLSSPFSGNIIADWLDDFDIAALGGTVDPWSGIWSSIQTYNETLSGGTDTGWTIIPSVSTVLNRGQGYTAYIFGTGYIAYGLGPNLPSTADLTGIVDLNPLNFNIDYTNTGDTVSDGWNFIGNPYPTILDWDQASGWTKTDMNNATYVWRSDLNQFASYIAGMGTNGGTKEIASGQGFMVKARSSSSSLSINRNASSTNTVVFHKQSSEPNPYLLIKLDSNEDETLISINTDASVNFDGDYDAYKISSNVFGKADLATLAPSNIKLSINSLPLDNTGNLIVPVSLVSNDNVNRTFTFYKLNTFPTNYCIRLEDRYLGKSIDLRTDSVYNFITVNDSLLSGGNIRFVISFTEVIADFNNIPTEVILGDTIMTNNTSVNALNYIWDFGNGNIDNTVNPAILYISPGDYIIELTAFNGSCSDVHSKTITVKNVVSVYNKINANAITVYPNPFIDNINLQLNALPNSNIMLYDAIGREIYRLNNVTGLQHIDLSNADNGIYYLHIATDSEFFVKKIVKP